jgi:hypothetical protein
LGLISHDFGIEFPGSWFIRLLRTMSFRKKVTGGSAPVQPAESESKRLRVDDETAAAATVTPGSSSESLPTVDTEKLKGLSTRELECRICMGLLRNPLVTECMHRFCKKCIQQHLRQYDRQHHKCPLCNKDIKTSRALKPDHKTAALVALLHPEHAADMLDDDDGGNDGKGSREVDNSIWMEAIAKHKYNVAKMRAQQQQLIGEQQQYIQEPQLQQYSLSPRVEEERQLQQQQQQQQQYQLYLLQQQLQYLPEPEPETSGPSLEELRRQAAHRIASEKQHAHTARVSAINAEYKDVSATDLLGLESFRVSKGVRAALVRDGAADFSQSIDTMIDQSVSKARERTERLMNNQHAAVLSADDPVLKKYLWCVPPIQVRFRKYSKSMMTAGGDGGGDHDYEDDSDAASAAASAATAALPQVGECYVSIAADATVKDLKATVYSLISDNVAASSSSKWRGNMALSLKVPVPTVSEPGSPLPFSGYTLHTLANNKSTMLQLNTWYQDCCEAAGGLLYDFIILYGLEPQSEQEDEEEEEEEEEMEQDQGQAGGNYNPPGGNNNLQQEQEVVEMEQEEES